MMDHGYALAARMEQIMPIRRNYTNGIRRQRDGEKQINRVNIGIAYSKWKALKEKKGFRNDADVACYLLDRYSHIVCTWIKAIYKCDLW